MRPSITIHDRGTGCHDVFFERRGGGEERGGRGKGEKKKERKGKKKKLQREQRESRNNETLTGQLEVRTWQ